MLSEGKRLRIASKVSDAVLAAAAAATMAQGPKDFVSFGAIQSPGVVRGQEEGRRRSKADINLDSGRVVARNIKQKTFKEFIEEAYSYNRHPHFSSKEELIKHHGGSIPPHLYPKNRGTKENPQWGLGEKESRKQTQKRREENIKITTGNLTRRERDKVERKSTLAAQRGQEVHHATEVSTSAKQMKNMSPGDRLRFKSSQARQNKYHGNDPRNLVLANKGSVSEFSPKQPGFHHGKYHSFERGNRKKLEDIKDIITPARAFTTLVNKERKKIKKSKNLQNRMATAYDTRVDKVLNK